MMQNCYCSLNNIRILGLRFPYAKFLFIASGNNSEKVNKRLAIDDNTIDSTDTQKTLYKIYFACRERRTVR